MSASIDTTRRDGTAVTLTTASDWASLDQGDFPDLDLRQARAALAQWDADEADDTARTGLQAKAATALDANRTYLALPTPTTAQMRAQLERVTRQTNALIRLVVGLLDDTSDT